MVNRKGEHASHMYETKKDHQVSELYSQLLEKIRPNVDPKLFDAMFPNAVELKSVEGNKALFVCESSTNCIIFKSARLPIVKAALKELRETPREVEVIDARSYQRRNHVLEQAEQTFFKNCRLEPQYTFENFVVGDSNRDAYRAALSASAKPCRANPIFFYSGSGLGKTHLLQAIGNDYLSKHPDHKVLYITADAFVDEYVKFALGKGSENRKDFFTNIDRLLVDDIQSLADKEKTQDRFFNIFNFLVSHQRQIVLTSDRAPSELKGLPDRLVSRFSSGLSVSIRPPEKNTLIGILQRKIRLSNRTIQDFDPEVLDYLSSNYCKNVRELEGAFTNLLFAIATHKPQGKISLEFVRHVFENDEKRKTRKGKVDVSAIIKEVADYYSRTETQLKSKVRTSQIALARQIARYLSRKRRNISYQEIGKAFGKDHTTVRNNVQKIEKNYDSDPSLKHAVDELTSKLKSSNP